MAGCLFIGQSFPQTLSQKGVEHKVNGDHTINHSSAISELTTESAHPETGPRLLQPELEQKQPDCEQEQPELKQQPGCEQDKPLLGHQPDCEQRQTLLEQQPDCEKEQPVFEQQPDCQERELEESDTDSEDKTAVPSIAVTNPPKPTSESQEGELTEIMEAQTVVQTQNSIPTMIDLEPENEGVCPQEETTEPRVPDLAGETDTSEKGDTDGNQQRLNGDLNLNEGPPNNNNLAGKEASSKNSGGKSKRKEDKAIEHILKALNSLNTTEEKLAALCKKYADLHEEHRGQQTAHKQMQKKLQITTREKDQLQSEHNKAVMAKGKLESLCRELQKQNKLIKEESLSRAREEEERRKEVSAKFQNTIAEIQTQMKDNHERNIKLKEENIELGHKLKNLVAQYETREEHIEKLMKHRDLETQLHEAKLQQSQCLLASEQEQNRKEREVVLLTMTETKKKSDLHEAQEKQLRSQLAMYTEKFDEFQTTLNKSNEVFGKFKTEMDKMSKRIKKLEKETAMWKGKWETSNKALVEMADEKQKHDKEKSVFRAKIDKLESLCRALQAERRGKLPEGNLPEGNLESDKEKTFDPTKTPPNTPDIPSRTSPETVQGAANGADNGEAESGLGTGPNTEADPIATAQVSETEQPPSSIPTEEGCQQEVQTSQLDDSGAAQLSQPEPPTLSNDTAAAPANQSDPSVQEAEQPN